MAAARTAFDQGPWPRLSHEERAGHPRAFAAELRRRSTDLAEFWSRQSGVLHTIASGVGDLGASGFEFYAGLAADFPFEEELPAAYGEFGLLVREHVGVVGAIVAWNHPVGLITYKLAPALPAGCTVVLKPAPEAPGEAYGMAEIAETIGLPQGVLNVLSAGREVSESLVKDERVDKIAFTGSTAAGRRIGSLLGGRIARHSSKCETATTG
ncbi:aldehyde dehydrogenase family protein [Streptomyces sp. NPDC026672]|uniref:aldehyde dehydrogenase family protein n=1 Tax=unclassified Streptomyces TaxID=2593676 RepID=UPI0033EA382B